MYRKACNADFWKIGYSDGFRLFMKSLCQKSFNELYTNFKKYNSMIAARFFTFSLNAGFLSFCDVRDFLIRNFQFFTEKNPEFVLNILKKLDCW